MRARSRNWRWWPLWLGSVLLGCGAADPTAGADWPQLQADAAKSGFQGAESIVTTRHANSTTFGGYGKEDGAWTNLTLAGQPVIAEGIVAIGCVTNADAHGGTRSAFITSQSMEAVVNTVPGAAYKATGWVRLAGVSGNDNDWGGFRLEAQSQNWQTLAHSGWLLVRTRGTNWFKIALSFNATGAQTRLEVGYFGGSSRQMSAFVDDLARPSWNPLAGDVTPSGLAGEKIDPAPRAAGSRFYRLELVP